jgi:hypothetical protein
MAVGVDSVRGIQFSAVRTVPSIGNRTSRSHENRFVLRLPSGFGKVFDEVSLPQYLCLSFPNIAGSHSRPCEPDLRQSVTRRAGIKSLLGICFLRGVPEDVVEEIGEGEKGGDPC